MRRLEPNGPLVIGMALFAVTLGAIGFFVGHRAQKVAQEERRAHQAEAKAKEIQKRYEKLVKDVLVERLHLSQLQAQAIVRTVTVTRDRPRRSPPSKPPPRHPNLPPSLGGNQPMNPTPNEPAGGEQGTLKPAVCENGLGPFFGIDCEKDSPMFTQQKMCQLGLDQYFVMACGETDQDGPTA